MMMNNSLGSHVSSNETELSAIFEDWIQLGFNAFCLLIGLPLNLVTLWELTTCYRATGSRIHLLYIHLNASDLMVIIFYSLTRFCWLITYEWYGGDLLCRFSKFADSLSFAISSYIIVCIGMDRTYSIRRPLRADSRARVTKMLCIAWLVAVVFSIPQLGMWQTYEPKNMTNFTQCVSLWNARADQNNGEQSDDDLLMFRLYSIYHILIVFWIPLVLLIVSYSMTLQVVARRHSNGSVLSTENARRASKKIKQSNKKKLSTQSVLLMIATDNSTEKRHSLFPPKSDTDGLRQMSGHARLRKARNRTMQVSVTLIAIYLCCWLPYNTLSWWRIIDKVSYASVENTVYFLNGLVVLNCLLNPLIYGRAHLMNFSRRIMQRERNQESDI